MSYRYEEIVIAPSPTQHLFITSTATIVVLIGPQGEGKTWAGAVALLYYAQRWKQAGLKPPVRACAIRDTHENIKRMLVPSINSAIGDLITWHDEYRHMKLIDGSLVMDLFGMDDDASLTKLQGAEYAFIWLEEPAPIIDRTNVGLSVNVFNVALSRVARQLKKEGLAKGIGPRLQVTMNPADESHWTFHEFIENPRFPSVQYPDITLEVYNIPYGENVNLPDVARQATAAAYSKNPALFARYVKGQWAFVSTGVQVTPEYNETIHRSNEDLEPVPGVPIYRGWDGGLHPACVVVQVFPTGRMVVLDSLVGENIGMRQFIKTYVKPLMRQRYQWFLQNRSYVHDVGDPTLMAKDQSNSDTWAAKIIEHELKTSFIPGESAWQPRLEAVKHALTTLVDGRPQLYISRHEGYVHRALRGGWAYRVDSNGTVIKDIPIKNIHSHPADALSYVLAYVLGYTFVINRPKLFQTHRRHFRRVDWRTA